MWDTAEGPTASLGHCYLFLSLHYYYLFLLTHLATSVAAKRDLEQIKDDCCALSCGKGAKVVFLFDLTGQVAQQERMYLADQSQCG